MCVFCLENIHYLPSLTFFLTILHILFFASTFKSERFFIAQNNLKNENYFETASPVDAALNFSVGL